MKIKRTKTGTKTSDSKHEIVKSEQNGNAGDDPAQNSNSKKQINVVGVPASSPTSSVNKRGNNSHRKDKVNWEIKSSPCSRNSFSLIRRLRKKLPSKKSRKIFLCFSTKLPAIADLIKSAFPAAVQTAQKFENRIMFREFPTPKFKIRV